MVAFQDVTRLSTTQDALHAPGLRFGDLRVMATLAATCRFAHVFADFANRDLREAVAFLLGCDYAARQATYDLRRLGRRKVVARIPGPSITSSAPRTGDRRVLHEGLQSDPHTGLAQRDPALPAEVAKRCPLASAWRAFDHALDDYLAAHLTAA